MESIPSFQQLAKEAVEVHKRTYGNEPDLCVFAPGRVNLIGEHTDYNGGFVFPMALPLVTMIVGNKTDNDDMRIQTTCEDVDNPKLIKIPAHPLLDLVPGGRPKWSNYVRGVINFHPMKDFLPSFDATIVSSVPCGSGLSSSAALELSVFTFLDSLLTIERRVEEDMQMVAHLCQLSEQTFAQVPCGIMDQLISALGIEDHAILIDCRTLDTKPVLLEDKDLAILITNSNFRHELSSGEYAKRKKHCDDACIILECLNLRAATMQKLSDNKELMDEVIYRRARHVISENDRCQQAFLALQERDYTKFGELMVQSHNSLRDDFEVSCDQLDELVTLAMEVNGVYGSRMTGAGFGGCTVTLLKKENVDEVISHIEDKYSGIATFYLCRPSAGAGILNLKDLIHP